MKQEEMWALYTKINPSAEKYEAWAFGGTTPDTANQLAQLVLEGIKTATASACACYEAENLPLPEECGYNIILNSSGEAVCITKTTRVYVTPFCMVTDNHAYKEGEFDRTLSSWRECHKELFSSELLNMSQEFTEDMLVVCEEFELVYPEKQV